MSLAWSKKKGRKKESQRAKSRRREKSMRARGEHRRSWGVMESSESCSGSRVRPYRLHLRPRASSRRNGISNFQARARRAGAPAERAAVERAEGRGLMGFAGECGAAGLEDWGIKVGFGCFGWVFRIARWMIVIAFGSGLRRGFRRDLLSSSDLDCYLVCGSNDAVWRVKYSIDRLIWYYALIVRILLKIQYTQVHGFQVKKAAVINILFRAC